MATTTFIPLHAGKGKGGGGTFAALIRSVNYVKNPNKTDNGEWVTAYECDPLTVTEEFMFSKSLYAKSGGRDYGEHNVIGYHLRQAFKPNETDAATANRIGFSLALSLTKGKYAFICCTHTDKQHIHNHIIINSVSLDCSRKFRNFKNSSFAIRKISDRLCLENGLSIIENPKQSRGNYGQWLGDKKQPTVRDNLRNLIDSNIIIGKTFPDFLVSLKRAGCEIKLGKHIAVKLPDGKKNIRFDSLGDDYTEEAIRERLMGTRSVSGNGSKAKAFGDVEMKTDGAENKSALNKNYAEQNTADETARKIFSGTKNKSAQSKNNYAEQKTSEYAAAQKFSNAPSLLIDIQAKIKLGAGEGYVSWMRIFNIKQAAHTLIWLQENGIDSYEDLKLKSSNASKEFHNVNERLKTIGAKQKEINELQKQIGTYGKTREVYMKYKATNFNQDFFEANREHLTLHIAAKKYFDEQNFKGKLPSINSLKQEWAALEAEKRKLYSGYKQLKENYTALLTAKGNADRLLGEPAQEQTYQRSRDDGAR